MSTKRKSALLKTTVFFVMFFCLMVSSFGLKSAQAASARKLNYTKKTVEVSKTFTLKVNNLQSGDTVKYATSDADVVTISSKGICKGVAPGEAIVAATITDKNKKQVAKLTCKVTVKEMRIPTISDVTLIKDGDFIIGTSASIAFSFKADKTTAATISVCNSSEEAVYEKTVNLTKNETMKFTWKGLDNNGEDVESDLYFFRVDCDNASAQTDYFNVTDISDFSKGNGSAKNPYQIKTIDEFRLMSAHNNCHFILMNDIDAEYEALQNLFTSDIPFNGTLDGNGKSIKNLMNTTALFNAIGANGVIKNLKITNATLVASKDNALLTYSNKGLIEKCTISNASMTGHNGGLFAVVNEGEIKNCKADGNISFSYNNWTGEWTGGLVCDNRQTGKVMNCSSAVDINIGSRDKWAGGVVGYNRGLIVNCTYSGTISANAMGSIVERNAGVIINCSYLGNQEGLNIKQIGGGIVK